MMKLKIGGALAMALYCTVAQGDGLTLEAAQQRALARSQQLVAQGQAVQSAQQLGLAAAQLPDPTLKVGVDNLPTSGADRFSLGADGMTMRRIGLMQELTRADKRSLRAGRYALEAQRLRADQANVAASVERAAAIAWLDVYFYEAMLALVRDETDQAAQALAASEAAYRGGRASQADLLAARGAQALAADRASEAARKLANARVALARWIGSDAGAPLGALPDLSTLGAAAQLGNLSHHPEIAAADLQRRIAGVDVQLARANQRPDWTLEVTYAQRGPGYPNMVSVGLSLPLQWNRGQRQDREVAASVASAAQADAQREELLRAHEAETQAMLNEWRDDRARLQRFNDTILPLARERVDVLMAAYRGGKTSLAEVLDGRRAALELRLQALQLEADGARLWAQLTTLTPSTWLAAKETP